MRKICFALFVIFMISFKVNAQLDYRKFVSKILITHEKKNNYEKDMENLIKSILNNERDFKYLTKVLQIDEKGLDSLRNVLPKVGVELPTCKYEFITNYRIDFKKMPSLKKKQLKREKFFNYLSTKQLYHVETYVFCKGGGYLGSLRGGATGDLGFIYDDNEVKKIAENFYHQIYTKTKPSLFFSTIIPFVQDFIITNDSIKPIDYDRNFNWHIYEIQDFIDNEKFHSTNLWDSWNNNGYKFLD